MHTGEKPFACDFCDYRASRKSNLTTHLRVHTGETPYVCHLCDYRATKKSTLSRHVSRVHTTIVAAASVAPCTHPAAAMVEDEQVDVLTPQDECSECVVCLDDPTAFTCMPCGHQCVCAADGCTAAILGRWRCPMCDQEVRELMHAEKAAAVLRAAGRRVYHC
mmetsp:Transcript_22000/g.57441  ORF Transcript_22000/g.57441 Transcript_22000/m.57441 type:complete len:163 (-) Transcript_22000:26-514(-)